MAAGHDGHMGLNYISLYLMDLDILFLKTHYIATKT